MKLSPHPTSRSNMNYQNSLPTTGPTLRDAALSTSQLVTTIIGAKSYTTAQELLGHRSPQSLLQMPPEQMRQIAKLSQAQLDRIQAALELGRRLWRGDYEYTPLKIGSPQDAANVLAEMQTLEQEQLRVLCLNTRNHLQTITTVYQGSLNTTMIRIAEVFRPAILHQSAAIIVAHNHPSGDPTPSPEDVRVTQEIVKTGKALNIEVLDHMIIGTAAKYVSMKERGLGFS